MHLQILPHLPHNGAKRSHLSWDRENPSLSDRAKFLIKPHHLKNKPFQTRTFIPEVLISLKQNHECDATVCLHYYGNNQIIVRWR